MAEKRIGVFTPEEASDILAAFRWLKTSGFMTTSGFKAPNKDLGRTPIYVKNTSGEEIPAFACMQAIGTEEIGRQNYVKVTKPLDDQSAGGHYLFNGFHPIDDSGLGTAFDGPFVRVITDDLDFGAGDTYGPQAGSWKVSRGGTLLIAAGPDDIRDNVIRAFIAGGGGGGGGGTEVVIFQIDEKSGTQFAASNLCEDKLLDAGSYYEATVLWRPCGVTRVSGETSNKKITVFDPLNSFLKDREDAEVQGKVGVAVFMKEDGGYECQWVITFIDWWREIQVLHDLIHTTDEIRVKVKKIKCWDDCDLEDIVIPLIDCEDTSG